MRPRPRGRRVVIACLALVALAAGCAPPPTPGATTGAAYVQRISADRLDDWRGVHFDGLVLDVRLPNEWSTGLVPLPNSTFISSAELSQRIGEIESYATKPVLVVDRAGESAVSAAQFLVNRGFRDVTALDGGLAAYRAIYPESR
jgi:rhodanese-related sulfurtransferase